jgi:hypothetical protein
MVAGASGVVEFVKIVAYCFWGAVYYGITTECMGHHFPSGICHALEDGAVVIHVVPRVHLLIHYFMDQVVTVDGMVMGMGMGLHLRLHRFIKLTVCWSLP